MKNIIRILLCYFSFFFPSQVSLVIVIEIPQNVLNPKIKNTDNSKKRSDKMTREKKQCKSIFEYKKKKI